MSCVALVVQFQIKELQRFKLTISEQTHRIVHNNKKMFEKKWRGMRVLCLK